VSKILFINCYDDMMLALRTMSAQLQADGHVVSLLAVRHLEDCFTPCVPPVMHPIYNYSLQTTQKEVDHVMTVFEEVDPDWVGFSVTSNHIGLIRHLGNLFKEAKPGIPIIWGGADVWFNAEEDSHYADVIVLSEADEIINDLAKALDGDKDLAEVPGIWYKDRSGEIHKNPKLDAFEDLESLPPGDWSLDHFYEVSADQLFRHGYHPISMVGQGFRNVMTARGCPFTCSFCCNGYEKEDVNLSRLGRQRSVNNVISELKHLMKVSPGTGMIYFSDEVFPMNRRWVEEFADVYHSEIGLPFACYAYPTTVKPWFAQALARMGECYVQMGIQSGSDRMNREVFHRFATQEDALAAGRIFAEHGILYSVDMIGYNPFETEEDYRENLKLLQKMPRPFLFQSVYELMFWKNFPITDRAQAAGLPLIQTNEHTWLSAPRKEYPFWHAMQVIAGMFQSISPDLVSSFVDNPLYRERPELLTELMQQLQMMNYTRTVTGNWQYKDKHIRDLESYYMRMEGSRAVKGYFAVKERVTGLVESGARITRNLLDLPSRLRPKENGHSATDELKDIFAEHRADTAHRKAAFENGDGKEAVALEGLTQAEGIVGTKGTNGTAMGKNGTRKRFHYPKAAEVRVGRAMGDVKREDTP
jgi:anaerobic magnesium-protoporphyrin IX monomethyl ester cyclase